MFMLHGFPKLAGGPESWEQVGMAMQSFGIDQIPVFFGFLAGITEFFGGLFLLAGIFFRPVLSFLLFVMMVAAAKTIADGGDFVALSHPLEIAIIFMGLLFCGPGKYSLQHRINRTIKMPAKRPL
jgi:putative oxidoreductase